MNDTVLGPVTRGGLLVVTKTYQILKVSNFTKKSHFLLISQICQQFFTKEHTSLVLLRKKYEYRAVRVCNNVFMYFYVYMY